MTNTQTAFVKAWDSRVTYIQKLIGRKNSTTSYRRILHALIAALAVFLFSNSIFAQSSDEHGNASNDNETSGPIWLTNPLNNPANRVQGDSSDTFRSTQATRPKEIIYKPGEFEIYVNALPGVKQEKIDPQDSLSKKKFGKELAIRRLGAELMTDDTSQLGAETARLAPPDYAIGIGDEIQLTLWGSVTADLRLTVDRAGRIVIPRVGPVLVAGVRYTDLNDTIQRRVAQVFRNFQLTTALGKLRNIRIYVTGFTPRPGAYTVSSLATVVTGLIRAGGPSAAGSFRKIELRRNGQTIANFDLYDLLFKGDKSTDRTLQADDVIHIAAVGSQIAILGSVNKEAIVELKPGETTADVLAIVGGFNAVADRTRVVVERLSDRKTNRALELALPAHSGQIFNSGDVVRVFSQVNAIASQYKQQKRIIIEGEVVHPGEYVMSPNSSINDAIKMAGGLTPEAFLYGAEFTRENVRKNQQANYERALRDTETELSRNLASKKALSADEAKAQEAQTTASQRLIERLRTIQPTGRIVLQLDSDSTDLPDLTVEEGDRLLIPPHPTTVGVFGSVYNYGSYLLEDGGTIGDILHQAGGPTRGADEKSAFVIRANGSVVSAQQSNDSWLKFGHNLNGIPALPGDTIFMPEEMNKTTFLQGFKEWTQILYQFGLGAAALKTLQN